MGKVVENNGARRAEVYVHRGNAGCNSWYVLLEKHAAREQILEVFYKSTAAAGGWEKRFERGMNGC